MKIHISNVGPIIDTEIELNKLTVVCGHNNTGKTYLSYVIYGLYSAWLSNMSFYLPDEFMNSLLNTGEGSVRLSEDAFDIDEILDNISSLYSKSLNKIFSTEKELFENSNIKIKIDDFLFHDFNITYALPFREQTSLELVYVVETRVLTVKILKSKNIDLSNSFLQYYIIRAFFNELLKKYNYRPYIMTAERAGISLFYKELDMRKSVILDKLSSEAGFDNFDPFDFLGEVSGRYPKPISANIDYVRDYEYISKNKSELFSNDENIAKMLADIIGGKIKIEDKKLYFSFKIGRKTKIIPIYAASSLVKTLLGLSIFINYYATTDSLLMIDEPELNLHPENQRKLARLLVYMVNKGVSVFITTHSDYILREFNNMIMLSNDFHGKNDLMAKLKYNEYDILNYQSITAYVAKKGAIKKAEIDNYGVSMDTFDDVIDQSAIETKMIYSSLEGGC